jgi:hypothetical protein
VLARAWRASWASRSSTACCSALLGSAATFAPLVADTSLWFVRRRGIAVAICASGNYVAGAIWPPIVQHFIDTRAGVPPTSASACSALATMPLLALACGRARPGGGRRCRRAHQLARRAT